MRVLVDTSVWALALRRGGPADHRAVRALVALLAGGEDLVLIGIILQEVLQGFRSEATAKRLEERLRPFPLLALERSDYVVAARLRRSCLTKGVSASTIDCLIASAAIAHGCSLLTADDDFGHIARHTDLELV